MQPDTILVAISRVDGGLTLYRIVTTEYSPRGEVNWTVEPTDEYINSLIAKLDYKGGLAPVSWRRVPDDFVDEETDRTYRNAWKDSGHGKPDHDMVKARNIHRNILRDARSNLLDRLDAEYMKADEDGDNQKKKDIAKEKQRLRDITADPRIEAAASVEELKSILL